MSDMINASLQELASALVARRISAVELATLYLDRIERLNPRFNAFVTVESDKTLAQARAADAQLASGNAGPLAGIPLAYKDIFCTKGMLTTCGSKMLANFVAPYDAHVVERLNHVGVVNLGKLNMDEFAMGSSTENSCHGPTLNPWDITRVPGGSSGGSAAAVSARLTPAALGTDTGGSIRQPAAMCGLSGIKPTYGIVSRYGMVAYASSLDQGGPMARSAADCALVLNGIAGFDPRDSTSLERPAEDYTRDLNASIKGLRIGIPREFFAQGMDDEVRVAVDAALDVYRSLGAEIVDVDLPNSGLSVPAYYVVAPAEASSNLSRYDGVRYGYRSTDYNDLTEMYSRSRAEGFGAEVKRRILIGTYVLSHGYYDAYYLKAQKLRRLIAEDFRSAFAQCDVIMGPTSPFVAFPIGAKTDDPVQMYLSDIYTVSANLAGLPGMSIPCGFGNANSSNPMPVGLQILGPWFSEARMLSIAHQYQLQTDWHQRMPGGIA